MIKRWRHVILLWAIVSSVMVLLGRTVYLQLHQREFLNQESAKRAVRERALPTHRGIIRDRHGEPLAVSAPLDSLYAVPGKLLGESRDSLGVLAELLEMPLDELLSSLRSKYKKDFMYLQRRAHPRLVQQVLALQLPGVLVQQEYHRYYPTGEILAQVVGLTNIDGLGQEGLEKSFDGWLRGRPGKKRVLMDLRKRTVQDIESIQVPEPGRDLYLSIDRRLQYLAYRELLKAMHDNSAMGGALVMLNPKTGEVLAMVSLPSYNPNDRRRLRSNYIRNKAVTDAFEPGSIIKPFTVLAALLSGEYTVESQLDTSPGWFMVDGYKIGDPRNYGFVESGSGHQEVQQCRGQHVVVGAGAPAGMERIGPRWHRAHYGEWFPRGKGRGPAAPFTVVRGRAGHRLLWIRPDNDLPATGPCLRRVCYGRAFATGGHATVDSNAGCSAGVSGQGSPCAARHDGRGG